MRKKQSILDKAIIFATKAHCGQKRKSSGMPYIFHPVEAAAIAATMTEDENILAATVLHDVLEDTPVRAEELQKEFGSNITGLVAAETENKRRGQAAEDTWKIRKQETLFHLVNASEDIKIIALGDKLSNMRTIANDYKTIGDKVWDRFNQKNKDEHGWYYKSITEVLSSLKEHQAWQELKFLVENVFGKNQ